MRRITCLLILVGLCFGITIAEASMLHSPEAKITLTNFQFSPKVLTVKLGTKVIWINKEGTHTVSADDDSWQSPTLNAGQTFTHQFDKPGTYSYHCAFHGSAGGHDMAGTIKVLR